MAKGLNFRDFSQPTLPLIMNDAAATRITVTSPTVELVEILEANQDEINAIFERGDKTTLDEVWTLAARLISCNREGIQVTVDDLKGRYGVTYQMLYAFLKAYGEFIAEIETAKN